MIFVLSWKEPEPPPPDPNAVKPPMITEILKLEEEEEALAKVTAAANELADRLQGGTIKPGLGSDVVEILQVAPGCSFSCLPFDILETVISNSRDTTIGHSLV